MKNKGFTLIELLAIIVLLGVLALIVYPLIVENTEKKNKEIDKATLQIFYSAADEYIKANPNLYQKNIGDTYCFNIRDLYNENLIPIDIKKYEEKGINIKIGEKNSYSVVDKCGEYISTITENLLSSNEGNTYTYMGGTYLKGVQESNYVWYNGFLWRILGKNQDGTIRLITEEDVGSLSWGATNDWNATGYIKDWLNNYFYNSLDIKKNNIIQKSNWCINATTNSSSVRTDCTGGTLIESKVGLLSLDEYNLSEASVANNNYILENSQWYWTLTPYNASNVWSLYYGGPTKYYGLTYTLGIRPVINVSTTSIIAEGNGRLKNNNDDIENKPYILNQATSSKTGKLSEKVSSGEYVSLLGKTYRVVSKDINGIKLIYDGYYEETIGTTYNMVYGSNNNFSISSGVGQKLNNDVLTWLGNSDKILETNWYQTSGFAYGETYTTILNDTSNPINAKVGLIRIGEMMSGQSASVLTNKYTATSFYTNAKSYWSMSKHSVNSRIWLISSAGFAEDYPVTSSYAIRPVIVVSNSTTIKSGNGTLEKPYIID